MSPGNDSYTTDTTPISLYSLHVGDNRSGTCYTAGVVQFHIYVARAHCMMHVHVHVHVNEQRIFLPEQGRQFIMKWLLLLVPIAGATSQFSSSSIHITTFISRHIESHRSK